MSTYARISGGAVAELFTPPAGVAIGACFYSTLQWVDCTATPGVAPGWIYSGGAFTAPGAAPAPTLAQQAAALLATGCAITSTGTPALNATYAVDFESRADVQAELISILVNGVFTNGATTFPWPDASGTTHTFTVAEFKALATALGAFVGTLKPIITSNSGTLPVQPSVIA